MADPQAGWINIAKFPNSDEAESELKSLVAAGIPALITGLEYAAPPAADFSERYIWIPEELIEQAKFVLARPSISEEELTKLALQSPPPEDA
jgi:hypothetical protein